MNYFSWIYKVFILILKKTIFQWIYKVFLWILKNIFTSSENYLTGNAKSGFTRPVHHKCVVKTKNNIFCQNIGKVNPSNIDAGLCLLIFEILSFWHDFWLEPSWLGPLALRPYGFWSNWAPGSNCFIFHRGQLGLKALLSRAQLFWHQFFGALCVSYGLWANWAPGPSCPQKIIFRSNVRTNIWNDTRLATDMDQKQLSISSKECFKRNH